MHGVWILIVLVAAVLAVAATQSAGNTQSGCEVCASTGDCSRPYRGEQGQFCGNWLDRQNDRRPCCCPDDAVCKVSNYACNCGAANPYRVNDGASGLVWLWWLLGALALLLCCCVMAFKRAKERGADSDIPLATPVTGGGSGQPYGSAPYASAPEYAGATPTYSSHYGQSGGGGMGAGTGAALGGTTGLLGGLLLGETLADHGNGEGGGGLDGGGVDGGGMDFSGDF